MFSFSSTDRATRFNNQPKAKRFVVQISTPRFPGGQELDAHSLTQALELSGNWIKKHGADYVEIFRVLHDGTLNPTIGAWRADDDAV